MKKQRHDATSLNFQDKFLIKFIYLSIYLSIYLCIYIYILNICNHENNKTMCPRGYHHYGFVETHALGHMIYRYINGG